MMLVKALNQDNQPLDLKIAPLGKINFYQLLPLYQEELDYKMTHDADSLLDLFDDEALLGVIDNQRKNFGIE